MAAIGRRLGIVCLLLPGLAFAADGTLDAVERAGLARAESGRQAQQQVEVLGDRSRELLDAYQAELKLVDDLETYVGLLDAQLAGQREEIATLQTSITDVAAVERQLLPLLLRMVDALSRFVTLDVPFLQEERRRRIDRLETLMTRADVTVAEKVRRVFEAYQIENEYGRTLERYTAKLELDDGQFDAEFLRIGRLGLFFRIVGSADVGYYDRDAGRWQRLPSSPWRRLIDDGLKVAGQEVAPQLVHVPLDPAALGKRETGR